MLKRILLALIIVMFIVSAGITTRTLWPGLLPRELLDPAYAAFAMAEAQPTGYDLMAWGQMNEPKPPEEFSLARLGQLLDEFAFGRRNKGETAMAAANEADLLRGVMAELKLKPGNIREVVTGPFRGYESRTVTGDGGQITVTVKKADPKTGMGGPWVFITLHRLQPENSDLVWQKRIRSCLRTIGAGEHLSTTYSGVIDRLLQEQEQNSLLQRMLGAAEARDPSAISTGNLFSVTAYSPLMGGKLAINGRSVNLNIAFRRNETAGRTFVTVGSPLITTEY